ncbi:M24 family metallopeptidase [Chloroflexota bacterium]
MSQIKWYNSFSEKERDRRWKLVRELMQNRGMDALLVLGVGFSPVDPGRGPQMQTIDRYLSGWVARCSVVFPLKGEPVLLGVPPETVLRWTPEFPKEELPWIEDVRAGEEGETVVSTLKEKGLERGRVGVALSGTSQRGRRLNATCYAVWDQVAKELPDCDLEDIRDGLLELMMVKSEEELTLFRRAAQAMEQATIAVVKTVRAGATELDIYLAIIRTLYENGAIPSEPFIASGPATTIPEGRLWNYGVGSPRVLEPGDVVNTGCIFAYVGGVEAQGQQSVAIPPVSPENAKCAQVAYECYEAGLRALRPGRLFKEVADAMLAPLEAAGGWNMFPLIHGLNPGVCGGFGSEASERRKAEYYKEYYQRIQMDTAGRGGHRGGEVVLKPGMLFEFEPNCCLGRHRVNVGGNVIVTEKGAEPLNKMGTQMRIAGEA